MIDYRLKETWKMATAWRRGKEKTALGVLRLRSLTNKDPLVVRACLNAIKGSEND